MVIGDRIKYSTQKATAEVAEGTGTPDSDSPAADRAGDQQTDEVTHTADKSGDPSRKVGC